MTLQLTKLNLNLHHAQARRDLGNPYDMHRTLARAFASSPDDTVKPFLWRLEAETSDPSTPALLVQSHVEPQWENLPDGYFDAHAQRSWIPETVFSKGRSVMFRVRAGSAPSSGVTQEVLCPSPEGEQGQSGNDCLKADRSAPLIHYEP